MKSTRAAMLAAVLLFAALGFAQDHSATGTTERAEKAAEHGEGHEEAAMPNEIWWKWANFAILAIGLGYLINKNAGPFFNSRSEAITKDIAEATRTREDAEAKAADIERRVSNLAAEVQQLRKQSKEELARESDRQGAETEASLRKIQAQAQAEIESAAKHASQELKATAARLALSLAESQIREQLSETGQEQLTGSYIEDLRRKAERN